MKNVFEIALLVPGMPFDGGTLETKSLGGSETAGLCLARELARLGHKVWVFCNCENPGVYDGVVYQRVDDWGRFATKVPFDLAIAQRVPEAFAASLNAKFNVLWCHDLALGRAAGTFRSTLWNLDKLAVVSQFMRDQYKQVYAPRDDLFFVTRNGVDLDLFPRPGEIARRRKTLIYGARPERGLDILLGKVMPRLLKTDPDIKLQIASYDNHPPQLQAFYAQCVGLAKALPPGTVENLGSLPKKDYYQALAGAGVYVYPTPSDIMPAFREVSCISAMEAQAAGTPFVSFALGALPGTLAPGAGFLVDGLPSDDSALDKMVTEIQRRVYDGALHGRESEAGMKHAQNLGWDGVARDWIDMLEGLFDRDNSDQHRLVTHFVKHSDVEAVRYIRDTTKDEKLAVDLGAYLSGNYGFIESDEAFKEYYASHGQETLARLSNMHPEVQKALATVTKEVRFDVIQGFLEEHQEIQDVLDYGCGHGWHTVYMANKVGRRWVGVDVDPGAIQWCRKHADGYAVRPEDLVFVEGDHLALGEGVYDGAIVSEVLEHVRDPYEVIKAVERSVKVGGWVLITVPAGPVEFGTMNWITFRNHVREWSAQDLCEIFGTKKAVINYVAESVNAITGDQQGFYCVRYQVDHEPVGRLDMERKIRYQRPRETLSVFMIVGGAKADEHLHSCLRSVVMVSDELIVADCGMTPETRRIVQQYPAKIIPGRDPKVFGFDEARNLALAETTCDWCLWIDTDETLINTQALGKYLRWNGYDGYSIQQHHFAVDTKFKPDMPVRLFRRVLHDGTKLQFFGAIHEHPEKELNKGPGDVVALSDVHIGHPGYYHESTRRDRFQRNTPLMEMDRRKHPDRLLNKHFICRDNVIAVSHMVQQNGGVLTPDLRRKLQEVVELAQEEFIGKDTYYGIDFLEFYSQANVMLGQGFDAVLSMVAQRDSVAVGRHESAFRPEGNKYRFARSADYEAELGKHARQTRQFDQEYW